MYGKKTKLPQLYMLLVVLVSSYVEEKILGHFIYQFLNVTATLEPSKWRLPTKKNALNDVTEQ